MGTDCGIAAHGTNLREPAYLVESGMTPMGAILAGTSEAAELLGPAHEIGTPEPGKRADLVIARGNSPTGIAPPRQARERPARGEGRRALQGHGRPRSLTVICHTNGRGPGASSIRALISTREHITASVGGTTARRDSAYGPQRVEDHSCATSPTPPHSPWTSHRDSTTPGRRSPSSCRSSWAS
ncbi:amidohydrolase family protein [Streptomyces sp. NPDC058321]